MTGFRVCLIVPQGYPHAACFAETGLLLRHSLLSLGFDCDLALNELARSRVNIILGVNLLDPSVCFGDGPVILYQLEQLSDTEGWFTDQRGAMLSRADAVWDYSPDNVLFLRRKGIEATYLPLGFHPALKTIPESDGKDIDVLFVGSLNDRRSKVLSSLRERGHVVKEIFGIYGRERDEYIARSRLLVNIHFYEASIFEAVRLSYLLNNEVFVVSESSIFYPWQNVPMPRVSYDEIVDACDYWLKNELRREKVRREMNLTFERCYPMTDNLSVALKHTPLRRIPACVASSGEMQNAESPMAKEWYGKRLTLDNS